MHNPNFLWDAKVEDLAKRLYIEHAEKLGGAVNSKKIANGCIASAAAFYEELDERRSEINKSTRTAKIKDLSDPHGLCEIEVNNSGCVLFSYFDNDTPAKYKILIEDKYNVSCIYPEGNPDINPVFYRGNSYPAWATAKFMHNNKIFVSSTERMQFDEEKQVWFSPYPNTKIAECFNEVCLVSAKDSLVTLDLPF